MDTLFTVDEVANWARVKPFSIRRFIDRGQLKAIRIGSNIRLTAEAVSEFVGETVSAEDISHANQPKLGRSEVQKV